jgi:hypothetical protein
MESISQEWKVLKNGKIFSDRLNSEDDCTIEIDRAVIESLGNYEEFTFEKMTDEDLQQYDIHKNTIYKNK